MKMHMIRNIECEHSFDLYAKFAWNIDMLWVQKQSLFHRHLHLFGYFQLDGNLHVTSQFYCDENSFENERSRAWTLDFGVSLVLVLFLVSSFDWALFSALSIARL